MIFLEILSNTLFVFIIECYTQIISMKRTKEAYFISNPTQQQIQDTSGLTFLFGEDQLFEDRKRRYQRLQKQYLDEQVQQKKSIQDNESKTNKLYDKQLLHTTHQRGQLELQKHKRLHEMEKAQENYNIQLMNERKTRQKLQREKQLEEERRQLQLLAQRKVKRILPKAKLIK